ncbi:MAG: hypothetical protein IIV80_05485, partial [Clostridia bacterium]|nr:hypothetical protein [Clostridia bacterium]
IGLQNYYTIITIVLSRYFSYFCAKITFSFVQNNHQATKASQKRQPPTKAYCRGRLTQMYIN